MTASVDLECRAYVKRSLTQDDLAFLKDLQHELNNQPTLATADPRFGSFATTNIAKQQMAMTSKPLSFLKTAKAKSLA
jgi:hypothetical protein